MVKFIVVTGSLLSGLGKGITASSIGLLLQSRGLVVTSIKIDPYLNIDSGTLSPYEHGECFVLFDRAEVDLDLGNYERFLSIELTSDHSITTGKVYNNVLRKERNGEYLGKTVQVVPHITDEIKRLILKAASKPILGKQPDVCICEIGGTIGDIETTPFIEALRLMARDHKSNDFCFVHLSMIICLDSDPESQKNYKTKPTQHSVAKLREQGINLDILVMRTPRILNDELKNKLSMFCGIDSKNIISNINVPNIYYVPQVFEDQGIFDKINRVLRFKDYSSPDLNQYNKIIEYYEQVKEFEQYKKNNEKREPEDFKQYKLLIVGKYTGTQDTYLSLIRAIEHAVFHVSQGRQKDKTKVIVNTEIIDAEKCMDLEIMKNYHGCIIPGGFGSRGIDGKLRIAQYCRENNIPILGICLGMQIMVCEFARNMCGLDATSDEWLESSSETNLKDSVVCILPGQNGAKGGTMRLGNYTTTVCPDTLVHKLYGQDQIVERHRHRYEINSMYVDQIQNKGLKFVGTTLRNPEDLTSKLMEITELDNHPFYIGCQYHPEFKSKYNKAHPLFVGLINAMVQH